MLDSPFVNLLDDLRGAIDAHSPDALLLEPWLMRRIIRLDRRLTGLTVRVPHRECYTIKGASLLAFVDRTDLDVEPTREFSDWVILLNQPTEDIAIRLNRAELLLQYWRLLFHARVHLELDGAFRDLDRVTLAAERWREIGACEQAEIRNVLVHEEMLFSEADDWEAYVEFAAVYLELRYFAPDTLKTFFPAIQDWSLIDRIASRDVPHRRLLDETQLGDVDDPAPIAEKATAELRIEETALIPREPKLRRLRARAEKASQIGNSVRAAITWRQAVRFAAADEAPALLAASRRELEALIHRLCTHLHLPNEHKIQWLASLSPLVDRAAINIWSTAGRVLYDLQRACLEHESEVVQIDVMRWAANWGREPIRRPAPLLRDVLVVKHLRTAARRIAKSQLVDADPEDPTDLANLLSSAVEHVEQQLRARIKPLMIQVLDEVGLTPTNVPERVARNKLIEELLDKLVDHGFLNIGNLRDSLAKGDLKIPDVSGLRELVWGDQVLRADRRFSQVLPGVYRPAVIYLRWSQSLSSLAFGTKAGRLATTYLVLPFGGAYVALEGIRHAAHWFMPDDHHESPAVVTEPVAAIFDGDTAALSAEASAMGEEAVAAYLAQSQPKLGISWGFLTAEIVLGVFILLLLKSARFRSVCQILLQQLGRLARQVFVELPYRLLRFRWIEQLLHSPAYAAVRTYVFKPAIFTAVIQIIAGPFAGPFGVHWLAHLYLASALFLNSPIGRYADEWLTDVFVRMIEEFRVRVLAALVGWIMGIFQRLLAGLTRVLHTLDEWTRFRARDNRPMKVLKLIGGAIWSIVSYVIVFVSTLLIEPQVNPIKHFPVVTVSHKLILPFGPILVKQLSPFLGLARAHTVVWSTIWLIPGVFGFLVWELRENWRLYAANRPRQLRPAAIGHHGESMVGLLRPSFHSGLLPKLFARLRRAMQQGKRVTQKKSVSRQQAALHDVNVAIRHFIERELFELLDEAGVCPFDSLRISRLDLATNRVQALVRRRDDEDARSHIVWEEARGVLTCTITDQGLSATLPDSDRSDLEYAYQGLAQRSGADRLRLASRTSTTRPIAWPNWTEHWSRATVSAV